MNLDSIGDRAIAVAFGDRNPVKWHAALGGERDAPTLGNINHSAVDCHCCRT